MARDVASLMTWLVAPQGAPRAPARIPPGRPALKAAAARNAARASSLRGAPASVLIAPLVRPEAARDAKMAREAAYVPHRKCIASNRPNRSRGLERFGRPVSVIYVFVDRRACADRHKHGLWRGISVRKWLAFLCLSTFLVRRSSSTRFWSSVVSRC